MRLTTRITPCLWFDGQADEAARFYVSIFRNAKILGVTRHSGAGFETHGQPEGSVLMVSFELDGQPFTAVNGGSAFTFNEAVSLQINCDTQEDIDYYWDKLSKGADAAGQQGGWLKDKYGLSWQITPTALPGMIKNHRSAEAWRVTEALMQMKKIDLHELESAFAGSPVGKT
ncbi:MAG: VOC family protein [Acidobacteria bacterium]|nr:VOC family protein [Acidobacteriota bacterium]